MQIASSDLDLIESLAKKGQTPPDELIHRARESLTAERAQHCLKRLVGAAGSPSDLLVEIAEVDKKAAQQWIETLVESGRNPCDALVRRAELAKELAQTYLNLLVDNQLQPTGLLVEVAGGEESMTHANPSPSPEN